jgi:hypothetical protein
MRRRNENLGDGTVTGWQIKERVARAALRLAAVVVALALTGCASQSAEVVTAEGDVMRVHSWTIAKDLQDPGGEFDAGAVRLTLGASGSAAMTPEQAQAYLGLLGVLGRAAGAARP